ncbi:cysteine desulfurase family protein [Arthrobacter roseus]|uniref:cysteine desulfurase family protein n=1 Tax=Arthrobacter roseus TaxID=136274 RepID=UPI001963F4FA|nr:cysteine desulfurase family protein [Arthrobacter roseus]MBM7848955.1 cysteine desulfurase [Arthrobacter roseus]
MIYLDAAATSPPRKAVLEAIWPLMTGDFGNPASSHSLGESAARAAEYARTTAAQVLGCRPGELVFTSGGTEANNLAIKGMALARPAGKHLVTSAVEHPSVLESIDYLREHHGFHISVLPVDEDGLVAPADLEAALTPQTTLCSIMYANNEVGTIQPVAELARICAEYDVPFHTDAVQAAGWLPLDVAALGIDSLSISGHKLGAPKGCGLLYVKGRRRLQPQIHGGGQQRGKRSGTENVAGAVAVGTVLKLAEADRASAVETAVVLRDHLIETVQRDVPEAILTGHRSLRLPAHASFCFPGTSGESVLLELDRAGVVCSSGSACAAGSDEPSTVLTAMGFSRDVAQTAVRLTFDSGMREKEMSRAARAVGQAVAAVKRLGLPQQ